MTAIEPTDQQPGTETLTAPAPEAPSGAEALTAPEALTGSETLTAPEALTGSETLTAPETEAFAAPESDPFGDPAAAAPQPAPAPARRSRLLLRASGAVLAAVLVGVGIGEAIVVVKYGDAKPAAAATQDAQPSASPSPAFGAKSNGNHFGSLRDLLLPVPTGFVLGPDAGAFGNDNEYGPDQLKKRYDAFLKEVPEKYRDRAKTAWESLHYKAAGVRTFQSGSEDLVVNLSLDQFNQQAISQEAELYGAMVDDTGVFRQGPGVPGHQNARCVLPPLRAGDELDYMHCFSAEGDLMVTLDASGIAPLDQNKVVDLFRQQLDRLARPGASV